VDKIFFYRVEILNLILPDILKACGANTKKMTEIKNDNNNIRQEGTIVFKFKFQQEKRNNAYKNIGKI